MFSYLNGIVKDRSDQVITLDVGTFAFEIKVPNSSVFSQEKENKIYTHMHWNAEQGPSLYGFATQLEKTVFLLITSCSGIGPKIGLAALNDLGAESFLQAVQTGNEKALSKVSGIGGKKAEQMIVQLKHKVAKLIKSGIELGGAQHIAHWNTVADALESLNYSRSEINRAMSQLQKDYADNTNASFDQLMRQALAVLTKQV
jgi:holliday junction DNA helicase RuvA